MLEYNSLLLENLIAYRLDVTLDRVRLSPIQTAWTDALLPCTRFSRSLRLQSLMYHLMLEGETNH